jgi:hypothetical protein
MCFAAEGANASLNLDAHALAPFQPARIKVRLCYPGLLGKDENQSAL